MCTDYDIVCKSIYQWEERRPISAKEDFDLATSPDQRSALNACALSRSLRLESLSSFEFRTSDLRRSRGVSSEADQRLANGW